MIKLILISLFLFVSLLAKNYISNQYSPISTFKVVKDSISGRKLFLENCTPCHKQNNLQLIGPGLASATTKHSMAWLIKWTKDSQKLINSGDRDAVSIFKDYNETMQPAFNFNNEQIVAIYRYIDTYNKSHPSENK